MAKAFSKPVMKLEPGLKNEQFKQSVMRYHKNLERYEESKSREQRKNATFIVTLKHPVTGKLLPKATEFSVVNSEVYDGEGQYRALPHPLVYVQLKPQNPS